MGRVFWRTLWPTFLVLALFPGGGFSGSTVAPVYVARVEQVITQVTDDFLRRAVEEAAANGAQCVIFELDTPGGILDSTRAIVKTLLNSPIPTVVYVAPKGARAASAGVFITVAANIAAMSPGTNIGAAHPLIGSGGFKDRVWKTFEELQKEQEEKLSGLPLKKMRERPTPTTPASSEEEEQTGTGEAEEESLPSEEMTEESVLAQKVKQDTLAWARSIAGQRHRNTEWVVSTIEEAISLTDEEALKNNIIDLTAENLEDLLKKIDGTKIHQSQKDFELHTKGAPLRYVEMTIRQNILSVLANPNVAYILLLLGFAGIGIELYHPGVVFPGLFGALCLLLSFYALQILPVASSGIALLLLGIVLFFLETQIVSHGFLTIGGLIAFVLGSLMLFESPVPELQVSFAIIAGMAAAMVLIFVFVLRAIMRTYQVKGVSGEQGMVGKRGVAVTELNPTGKVMVDGDYWTATSLLPIDKGEAVIVTSIESLKLQVAPAGPAPAREP